MLGVITNWCNFFVYLFLTLGQVEGAKLKEAQLRNELKTHNIDIPTTQQVQLPSTCESFCLFFNCSL